jgi:rhamnose utilization protein RhaD (predicted bifunctional aldolase and dehydrogenase)
MMEAVLPDSSGRPSVETPLHDSFDATFVVHTHMVLVNGLTCAKDGRAACERLFPDALWMDYIDPGYTLCMEVRRAIQAFAEAKGHQPEIIILKNHGVFVAGNTAEEIRAVYARLTGTLEAEYREAGVTADLEIGEAPDEAWLDTVRQTIQGIDGFEDSAELVASGVFPVADGPLSPDHIVYAKVRPYIGEATREGILAFKDTHGYFPKVLVTGNGVVGLGKSEASAALALELSLDGAQLQQLAGAFGGVEFMTDQAVDFIDNWEVEAFRKTVANV